MLDVPFREYLNSVNSKHLAVIGIAFEFQSSRWISTVMAYDYNC